MIRESRGNGLPAALDAIDNPAWAAAQVPHPLRTRPNRYEVLREISSPDEKIV